jgi:large subunit ribosomal protein L25
MPDVLKVTLRDGLGTRACRRLRQQGFIPAVLYGHGRENLNLAVSAVEVETAVRQGAQLVEMQGDVSDSALIREVQWNAFGTELLHVDLTRVSAEELVEVTVQTVLVGEAPGSKEGGIVEHHLHAVEIRCPAASIPERFAVRINDLQLGQSITAGDLELPSGAELLSESEAVIAICQAPAVVEEEEEAEAAPSEGVEPEVIGRKEEEEESGT